MAGQTSFTQEAADRICDELSAGRSLRSICLDGDMPSQSTVFRWLRDEAHEEFRQQYARARDNQADTLADEILDIADDGSNDYVGEEEKYNGDAVARSRLRVDARKWLAGELAPKKYGEKIDHTLANPDGSPVVFQTIFEKKPEA